MSAVFECDYSHHCTSVLDVRCVSQQMLLTHEVWILFSIQKSFCAEILTLLQYFYKAVLGGIELIFFPVAAGFLDFA